MRTDTHQLKRAIQISQEIQQLEAELNQILSSLANNAPTTAITGGKSNVQKRPATIRKRTAAAQAGRLANFKGASAGPATAIALEGATKPEKTKAGISAEGRARIIAAQKKRWAKVRAAAGAKSAGKRRPTAKVRQKISNAGQPKFRIL